MQQPFEEEVREPIEGIEGEEIEQDRRFTDLREKG